MAIHSIHQLYEPDFKGNPALTAPKIYNIWRQRQVFVIYQHVNRELPSPGEGIRCY